MQLTQNPGEILGDITEEHPARTENESGLKDSIPTSPTPARKILG